MEAAAFSRLSIHWEINLLAAPVWEVCMQPHQRHSYMQLAHYTDTVKETVIHLSSCDSQQCQQEESELKTDRALETLTQLP